MPVHENIDGVERNVREFRYLVDGVERRSRMHVGLVDGVERVWYQRGGGRWFIFKGQNVLPVLQGPTFGSAISFSGIAGQPAGATYWNGQAYLLSSVSVFDQHKNYLGRKNYFYEIAIGDTVAVGSAYDSGLQVEPHPYHTTLAYGDKLLGVANTRIDELTLSGDRFTSAQFGASVPGNSAGATVALDGEYYIVGNYLNQAGFVKRINSDGSLTELTSTGNANVGSMEAALNLGDAIYAFHFTNRKIYEIAISGNSATWSQSAAQVPAAPTGLVLAALFVPA